MSGSTLVYSTDTGRICPKCGRAKKQCACKGKKTRKPTKTASDGIIRIQREVKGRKGKTVTTVSGFGERDGDLKTIASKLKNRCGTGGTVKDGVIIIQGDHRNAIRAELTKQGYQAKLSGG
jgi:translation initiation factor 1